MRYSVTIMCVVLAFFLHGCAGMSGSSVAQKHPLDIAFENWTACLMPIEKLKPSYQNEVMISGESDPLYYQKLSSKRIINADYREFLVAAMPVQRSCNSKYLQEVQSASAYHVPAVVDLINKQEFMVLEVMQEKIKYFGEYVSTIQRVWKEFGADFATATVELTRQNQQELAARRAAAIQGLQVLTTLQQQQNQTWKNMIQQQNSVYQYKPPVTTNCYYIGNNLQCNSSQLGTMNNSTTNCHRIGNSIQCNTY